MGRRNEKSAEAFDSELSNPQRKESHMIDVLRVEGIKEMLLKMEPEERTTFLLLGYSSNQVSVLWKLVTIATN